MDKGRVGETNPLPLKSLQRKPGRLDCIGSIFSQTHPVCLRRKNIPACRWTSTPGRFSETASAAFFFFSAKAGNGPGFCERCSHRAGRSSEGGGVETASHCPPSIPPLGLSSITVRSTRTRPSWRGVGDAVKTAEEKRRSSKTRPFNHSADTMETEAVRRVEVRAAETLERGAKTNARVST